VIPVVQALTSLNAPISGDTTKPVVMAEVAPASSTTSMPCARLAHSPWWRQARPACVMYMQGQPRDMQHEPSYGDVTRTVHDFQAQRLADLIAAGIDPCRISLEPGFGFGKSLEHNLELFHTLSQLSAWRLPVLVGVSRKTMLGEITGQPVEARLVATAVTSVLAAQRGLRFCAYTTLRLRGMPWPCGAQLVRESLYRSQLFRIQQQIITLIAVCCAQKDA